MFGLEISFVALMDDTLASLRRITSSFHRIASQVSKALITQHASHIEKNTHFKSHFPFDSLFPIFPVMRERERVFSEQKHRSESSR